MMKFKTQAPIIAGLLLLGVVTYVQGRWSERWTTHDDLGNMAGRVERVPFRFGEWSGEVGEEQDPKILKTAGAIDSITRIYRDAKKESLSMFLLFGRPGQICNHTPEHCYPSVGFQALGSPVIEKIDTPAGIAEFSVNTYRKFDEKGGTTTLRVYWGYSADGKWASPESIKWTFGGQWGVFKMYVIVPVADSGNMTAEQNRAHAFIRDAAPMLKATLFKADGGTGTDAASADADMLPASMTSDAIPAPGGVDAVPAPSGAAPSGPSAASETTGETSSETSPRK